MSGHSHSHKHVVEGKNLLFSIFLNIIITTAQVVGGIISGSLALLSDALHNFSDVISLVISYVAHKLSHRQATLKQTFGLKRAELIAAFVNALTLIVVAIILIYEAALRFFNPVTIAPSLVILMSLLGIVANGLSVLLLKKDADHNLNMKSAYLHLLTDMLASIAVLIGGILMKYFHIYWVDNVMTLAIAVYLIIVGFDLLKKATYMLMLFTPEGLDLPAIITKLHSVTRGNKLYHIHLWHLTDHELHFEAHLDCQNNMTISEFNAIVQEIEEILHHEFNVGHCTIQPDFEKKCGKDVVVQE